MGLWPERAKPQQRLCGQAAQGDGEVSGTAIETAPSVQSTAASTNTAAIIGGAVGGGVGALLLIGGIICMFRAARKKPSASSPSKITSSVA